MMGGRISSSTSCGASSIAGRPGMRASTTPVTTRRMAGGTFDLFEATPTAAITASREIRI